MHKHFPNDWNHWVCILWQFLNQAIWKYGHSNMSNLSQKYFVNKYFMRSTWTNHVYKVFCFLSTSFYPEIQFLSCYNHLHLLLLFSVGCQVPLYILGTLSICKPTVISKSLSWCYFSNVIDFSDFSLTKDAQSQTYTICDTHCLCLLLEERVTLIKVFTSKAKLQLELNQ